MNGFDSYGSEMLNRAQNSTFRKDIFVAMSSNKAFQLYRAKGVVGMKSLWDSLLCGIDCQKIVS